MEKKIATLELTENAESDEIAMLLEDRIGRTGSHRAESNDDGTYDVFAVYEEAA
jgi:hypothetical protein